MTHLLRLRFNRKIINHLGLSLYKSLPPVISELISNAYDADAENVKVFIDSKNSAIVIEDDGLGMTFQEIDDQYLDIGRNRREEENGDLSPKKKRFVTGKKGLGKLAAFGVANVIIVSSVKDGRKNTFRMNYKDIRSVTDDKEGYPPDIIDDNQPTDDPSGTRIEIREIYTQSLPKLENLKISLSKRSKFFDEDDFSVVLIDPVSSQKIKVVNADYYNSLDKEYTWRFPEDFRDMGDDQLILLESAGVKGIVHTKPTPIRNKSDRGFVVYSRGKLAQEEEFFSERANDNFHSYVYGFFEIDIIDANPEEDFINTPRTSVLWSQDNKTRITKLSTSK